MMDHIVLQFQTSFQLTDLLDTFDINEEFVIRMLIDEGLIPLDYFSEQGEEEDD